MFWPIFSHFWSAARFPFYTRWPDSQTYVSEVLHALAAKEQGAPPRGRQLYFTSKRFRPFIQSVKGTLSYLVSAYQS